MVCQLQEPGLKNLLTAFAQTTGIKETLARLGVTEDAPQGFAPGHFYSPIPLLSTVFKREAEIFALPSEIPGIDLNVEGQLRTMRAIAPFSARQPFKIGKDSGTRFSMPNDNFGAGDAVVYFGLLHLLRPKRVLEIGSGYSTMVLLDSLHMAELKQTACTCIEPYPETLEKLLWRRTTRGSSYSRSSGG
ncbi:MAG: hypothetical protein WKF37_14220 [Bryobacteraceae bacterium]